VREFHVVLPLTHPADVVLSARLTRQFAAACGFPSRASTELGIVAAELSSNVLKYGVRGHLVLDEITHERRGSGLSVAAVDEGPPFHDFEGALRDGFDEHGPIDPAKLVGRGGIGAGLGAARRLTHEIGWEPLAQGKRVWTIRFLR
jgi:anti-sigma regulatory factor (Ser/Thr protein kinase)